MIKAVLFDLDNTLTDFMKMKKYCCEDAVTAMIGAGLPLSRKKALKLLYELYDKYGIEHQKIFQPFLKKAIGRIDWRILAEGIVAYRRAKNSLLQPYPKTVPTLIKLNKMGLKLGIVSDAPRMQAWMRLASMQMSDFFDIVITKDDVKGKLKPHQLPFKTAIHKLDVSPTEILFVGDNPDRDIKGAKEAGMKTALALYGEHPARNHARADYALRSVHDIVKVVKTLKTKK